MMARAHSPQFYCSFSHSVPCLAFVSRRSIEQHYFYLSLLSLSLSPCLVRLLASASLPSRIPLTLSLFLSLCLSPRPLSSYVSSPLPSIASFSLPAPFFFPTRHDSRIEFRRTTRCESAKKREGTRGSRYRNASRDGIYKLQKRERVSRLRAVSIARSFVTSFVKCRDDDGWACL